MATINAGIGACCVFTPLVVLLLLSRAAAAQQIKIVEKIGGLLCSSADISEGIAGGYRAVEDMSDPEKQEDLRKAMCAILSLNPLAPSHARFKAPCPVCCSSPPCQAVLPAFLCIQLVPIFRLHVGPKLYTQPIPSQSLSSYSTPLACAPSLSPGSNGAILAADRPVADHHIGSRPGKR